ncbi:MAG: amidohydrolase family protein, partial [Clostridiaceae bacterium]
ESDEMIVKAAKDIGIRLVLARTMYDWDGAPEGYQETVEEAVENTRVLADKYKDNDMVTVIPAPHSLHAASIEMVQAGHKLAKELGTCFHIHVAEEPFEVEQVQKEHNGHTPIELLDKIGVVDESMVIVHGVWLKDSEIRLLGEKGAKLAYCPSSNMFLADGITDIVNMMKSGVTIGLGSDGACSNNRISVFEEMRMVALLQKAKTLDAMCVNYKDAFKMGTEDGGKLLQLPVGKIEIGFKADFTGINMLDMSMQPISESAEQILPNIVYSMQPNAIEKVVVNGRLTVNNGKLNTVPENEIVKKVQMIMKEIEG